MSKYEIVWQTHTPVKYEDLPKEIKIEICNGCGGKGGIIVPPHALFYYTSCNHHDYGYGCGGAWKDRLKSDRGLIEAMRKDCASLPLELKLRYRPWCELYYLGVRVVGWKFFYYGQKRWPDLLHYNKWKEEQNEN